MGGTNANASAKALSRRPFDLCIAKENGMLSRIVNKYKTWVHKYELESKHKLNAVA